MTATSILTRPAPPAAPPSHPLVDAILALAAEWDGDMNDDRWTTIATGLVGDVNVEQLEHIAGVLAEAERVLDGTAGYACYDRRGMAESLEADAHWKTQLLASLVLAERRAS